MINPIKGTDAIIHHNAFFPIVSKSFWATSTTAQMVPKKNGTHNPTKITVVFKPIGNTNPSNRSQVQGSTLRVKDKEGIKDPKSWLKRLISPNNCQFGSKFRPVRLVKSAIHDIKLFSPQRPQYHLPELPQINRSTRFNRAGGQTPVASTRATGQARRTQRCFFLFFAVDTPKIPADRKDGKE